MRKVVPVLLSPLLRHYRLSFSLVAKLSLITILPTKLTMETDWFWLRLGMRLFTWLLTRLPTWFLTRFFTCFSLGFSLGLSNWFVLGANLSLGVGCGGTGVFPNFPYLSPLLSPNLTDHKAQPSKRLKPAIIIPS
jgi:hypothetical protein